MSNMAAPEYNPSIMDAVFSRSKMPRVTLDQPFPTTEGLEERAAKVFPVESTTLENGLRVVSVDSQSPIASVGTFIDSGSRYENHATSGISHFMESIAFKSTNDRSAFRLAREMLKSGINVACCTSREHTVYAGDALTEHVPQMVQALADVVQNPIFDQQELTEAQEKYADMSSERDSQADVQIMEAIHAAAYHNNTLGLPLYNHSNVKNFSAEVLQEQVQSFFTADRMVLSGVGVEHAKLVEMAEKEFGDLAKSSLGAATQATYTGGDVRLHKADEALSHVAIAFETASWHSQDLVPMCVLQMMMGGGGSFSAGGPGKGMYSRLYQNVLNQHHWVESANSFNSIFTDSAIFGMYGTAGPQQAGSLTDVMCEEFLRMAGPVHDVELDRAKKQLQSSVNMQLESRSLQVEDVGRQMITYNKVQSAQELCDQIGSVSAADVQRVASAMLKTAPSVSVFGNLSHVPRYDDISKRFN